MPRNYQRTKNNPYWLPHSLYRKVLITIEDYPRMKAAQLAVIKQSPETFGGPKNMISDPTANKGVRVANMSRETDAIDRALEAIPPEYRRGVWEHIVNGARYPDDAAYITYQRQRQLFIYLTAKNLKMI